MHGLLLSHSRFLIGKKEECTQDMHFGHKSKFPNYFFRSRSSIISTLRTSLKKIIQNMTVLAIRSFIFF
jgi:hypothetical protein